MLVRTRQASSCCPRIRTRAYSAGAENERRPYTFHLGMSWAGKQPHLDAERLRIPFPSDSPIGVWRDKMLVRRGFEQNWMLKVKDAGEDFFFAQQMRNNSGVSFGVADGVGGWVTSGVDPSLFAQALMYYGSQAAEAGWAGEPETDPASGSEGQESVEGKELSPYTCLDLAYQGVLREDTVQAGSSTACLLSLNTSSGLLRAANLGDSGFLISRSSAVYYKQPAQQHFFNCPRQLTKMPEEWTTGKNKRKAFSRAVTDSPSEAARYETKLRDGDIVVVYTDGLSDNVFPSEVASICALVARHGGTEQEQVQAMADHLVGYARDCMFQRYRPSPFEREAARQGMYFQGGKIDDVTVIVALVQETPDHRLI